MFRHARAIFWAQYRTALNFYPRARKGGMILTGLVGLIWYGGWSLAAVGAALFLRTEAAVKLMPAFLSGSLLLVFLYWQVIPLMMAATGAALDLRKLMVYPIPVGELFAVEVMLRITSGLEMLIVLSGAAWGLAFNPVLAWWAPLAVAPFIVFNLFLAVGIRDLLARLLARRGIREVVVLALVLTAALPQLFVARSANIESRIKTWFASPPSFWLPWTAAASLMEGRNVLAAAAVAIGWAAVAYLFGRWQFRRSLSFDAQAAASRGRPRTRTAVSSGPLEAIYRLPSAILADPLGVLVEKEIRFLSRAPRFRLVFLMGFTFGLLIWLPLAFGRDGGAQNVVGRNYLTFVSVYSLLLLGEVCFWNTFGFDRSAAQVYFLAPIRFSIVLAAKNLAALFFILAEMTAITLVCGLLRMPLDPARLAEAYAVTLVVSLFLMAAGNLTSIYRARAVNPAHSFRTSTAGRMQALLLLIYPVAAIPITLAYLARYAFESEIAFYAVLAVDAIIGSIVYWVALDSALGVAEARKEEMVAALSRGEGPITA